MQDSTPYERLWAPWRLPWIKDSSKGVDGCFICDMLEAAGENDREALLLYRGEQVSILMNRFPYSNGHLMVAPNRHISDPRVLTAAEWAEIGLQTQIGLEALTRTISPDGFNIGWNIGRTSGAGLDTHLHQHVVPRWNGDTNFMPVIGHTRVISQDLWESYDEIRNMIDQLRVS